MTDNDPPVDWDYVYLSNHYGRVTRPTAWFETAVELVAAAESLAPHVLDYWESMSAWEKKEIPIFNEHSYHHTFLMLYAFAIENYCKGRLVLGLSWEERERLRTKGHFPKTLKSHDLIELVTEVGFGPFSLEDEELLRRLTHASLWTGRYPVPIYFKGDSEVTLSDGVNYRLSYIGRDDLERVPDLARRVRDHVGAKETYRVTWRGSQPRPRPRMSYSQRVRHVLTAISKAWTESRR